MTSHPLSLGRVGSACRPSCLAPPPPRWGLTSFGMLNVSDPVGGCSSSARMPRVGTRRRRVRPQPLALPVATPSRPYLLCLQVGSGPRHDLAASVCPHPLTATRQHLAAPPRR